MRTRTTTESRLRHRMGSGVDARPDMYVARLAAEQWGVVSLDQLRECGLSPRAIAARVRAGRLHRIHREVYSVGHRGLSLEGVFLAALKACGHGAVLSHYSAAALWGLVDWDDRQPEVTVVRAGTRLRAGVRVHRTRTLGRKDIRRKGAIPVTSPARTLVDLAAQLEYRPLRRAVHQAQSLRLLDLQQLTEAMGRLGPRRGIRKLARIVATGPAPTRSGLEDALLELILRTLTVGGRRVIPDFRWPAQRLVVKPTAPSGTTTGWPEKTTRIAKPCSNRTASGWSESHGSR